MPSPSALSLPMLLSRWQTDMQTAMPEPAAHWRLGRLHAVGVWWCDGSTSAAAPTAACAESVNGWVCDGWERDEAAPMTSHTPVPPSPHPPTCIMHAKSVGPSCPSLPLLLLLLHPARLFYTSIIIIMLLLTGCPSHRTIIPQTTHNTRSRWVAVHPRPAMAAASSRRPWPA